MSLPGRTKDTSTTAGSGPGHAGTAARRLRRAVMAAALPLALGACGLPDWLGPQAEAPAAVPPATAGGATAYAAEVGYEDGPADAAVALAAGDFQLAGLDWRRAGPTAAELPAAVASRPAETPRQDLPQLAALDDGDLDGMRGGFLFGNGVFLNFGATVRNVVKNDVADVVVVHEFTFSDTLTQVVLQTTVEGAAPVVTVNDNPPPVDDPTPVDLAAGVQLATGDPETSLVVTNVSTDGIATLISNVTNNADVSTQTELNFFLSGAIGDLANADHNLALTSLTGGLNNSLINSLPQ